MMVVLLGNRCFTSRNPVAWMVNKVLASVADRVFTAFPQRPAPSGS
jgi:hypothetical protein